MSDLYERESRALQNKDIYLKKMLCGELQEEEVQTLTKSMFPNYKVRREFTKHSWHIITTEYLNSLEFLTKGLKVLEVCAGAGHTSRLMNQRRGCEWIATDLNAGENNNYRTIWGENVVKMEALEAVIYFQPDLVFVSWIPYESELDCGIASMEVPVIMVGESCGGCTGSKKFWNEYNPIPLYQEFPKLHDVPQWQCVHDETWIVHPDKLKKLYVLKNFFDWMF